MEINPLTPLILIPWDQLFKGFSAQQHSITLTGSMGIALDEFCKNPEKDIVHQSSTIKPSCFFDECLSFSDVEIEETYETAKELIRSEFYLRGIQQWLFGNRCLLKEFENFFNPGEVQYLEPGTIITPCTLFVYNKGENLVFSYPKGPEELICLQ